MDVTSHAGSPLRALVVHRGYWRWSVAAQMARLAPLMTALAFVLAGRYATGGYAVGGLMVTAYEVANVCGASFAGRFLDRRGPAVGAPRLLGLSALALTGLAAAVAFRAPAALLVLLAAIAGALAAGVGGGLRSLLSDAVPPRLLAPAIAIDATIIDMVVVAAPLLVLVAALVGPPGAIVAMAGASAVAALLVRGLRGAPDIAVSGVLPPPTAGRCGATRASSSGCSSASRSATRAVPRRLAPCPWRRAWAAGRARRRGWWPRWRRRAR